MRGRGVLILLLAGLSGVACGCGRAEPQFTPRAEVKELIPPAQDYLREVMEQNFGTPTEMVLWERFPLHYHAAKGTVAEQQPESDAGLKLTLEVETLPITPGMEVTFLSGKVLDAVKEAERAREPLAPFQVVSYDAATHELALSQALPANIKPAAGDHVVIGPGEVLTRGRLLYAEHCLHCHGVTGDGNGPTAKYLNPKPRDYRRGLFKFTSTHNPNRARRDDLARIVAEGIPGTYMPSFKLLTAEESTAIVEYVLWLSIRGEAELKRWEILRIDFSQAAMDAGRAEDPTGARLLNRFKEEWESQFPLDFDDETNQLANNWKMAQQPDAVVVPKLGHTPSSPESIARGQVLFNGPVAKCATCHGAAGLGDGPQTKLIQEGQTNPGLFDNWGNQTEPRNLRTGIYRGGRRPIDLYRRIRAGIKGTPMPPFGTLSDEEVWDLVNYVMSIPFEERGLGEGPYVPREAPEKQVAATNQAAGQ